MQFQKAQEQSDGAGALLAVLRLICEELHALAFDIAGLGDALSGEGKAASVAAYKLQEFDLLSQRILAQAQLLHGIEALLSSRTSGWREAAEALIRKIPFHAQRQRLTAALGGQPIDRLDANISDGGGLDWF